MLYPKEKSAAFSGHREIDTTDKDRVVEKLKQTIIKCYDKGIRNFYCGMAVGFDLLAAETILFLQDKYKDISLTAVIPFRGQPSRFINEDKERYEDVLRNASHIFVLSEKYYDGCMLRRNDFMIENSSKLIAYYNGKYGGGTFYTCRKAKKLKIPIINVF